METLIEQELLTTKEAAKLLRVSSATIGNMLRSGVVRGTKVGIGGKSSPWRIYKEDVMKYIERKEEKSSVKASTWERKNSSRPTKTYLSFFLIF